MRNFSTDEFKHIKKSIEEILIDAIDTLIQKAGRGEGKKVAQLLLHIYMYNDYNSLEKNIFAGIVDEEIRGAISHLSNILTASVENLRARQLTRHVVGQHYQTSHLVQLVKHLSLSFIEKTVLLLSENAHPSQLTDENYEFKGDPNPNALDQMIQNISPDERTSTTEKASSTHAARPPRNVQHHAIQEIRTNRQGIDIANRAGHLLATPRHHTFFSPAPTPRRRSYRIVMLADSQNIFSLNQLVKRLFNGLYQPFFPTRNRRPQNNLYIFCLSPNITCTIECYKLQDAQAARIRASNRSADLYVLYNPTPSEAVAQVNRVNILDIQNKLALLSLGAPDHRNFHTPHHFIAYPRSGPFFSRQVVENFITSLTQESCRLNEINRFATMSVSQLPVNRF